MILLGDTPDTKSWTPQDFSLSVMCKIKVKESYERIKTGRHQSNPGYRLR